MINIKNVTKKFGDKVAVDNITVEIPNGEIIGFIGPNGAGKTTTLNMITGCLTADEGDIEINGFSIKNQPLEAKRQFGFVPDSPDMFLRLKGIEYLNFMADIYKVSREERVERIGRLAKSFDLEESLNEKLMSYSHGMRQKLMIMGALISNPEVWILDEPLTGLDPKSAFELKNMMRKHTESGKTVIFSTHVLEVAEKLCDHIVIINHGKTIYHGTLENLKKRYDNNMSLEEIFLDVTKDF